jgi:hypothetical protein
MIDAHREAYLEEARGLFTVCQSSARDPKPVSFDEMAYVINEEKSRMLTVGIS